MLLLLQPLKSALRVLQTECNIIQHRLHLLLLQEPHHVPEHAARSKIDATKDTKLPQRAHHVRDLLSTTGAANHPSDCDQTVKPDCAQGLGHGGSTYHVHDVVNTSPFWCEAPCQLAPVRMLPVVDDMAGAEGEQPVSLRVRACYRDDIGSCSYCRAATLTPPVPWIRTQSPSLTSLPGMPISAFQAVSPEHVSVAASTNLMCFGIGTRALW